MISSPEHWNSVFQTEFGKESDRASVILAAAMLDEALTTLLRGHLVPVAGAADSLLDGAYAPISSFSAKIDLTHRLGLISTPFCRDLHVVRRIRNAFAHNLSGCSFDDSAIRNRVLELERSTRLAERVEDIDRPATPRDQLELVISAMVFSLWQKIEAVRALPSPSVEWPFNDSTRRVEKSKSKAAVAPTSDERPPSSSQKK